MPWCKHSLQISDFVDYHNHLCAHEGTSDMEVMIWHAELVSLGATIIKVCVGVIIPVEKNTNIAHNLFYTNDTTGNLTDVINTWFNKKADYNYDNMECVTGRTCKKYLNIVWVTIGHGSRFETILYLNVYLVFDSYGANNHL